MPIRDHNSSQSATERLERDWFKKSDIYEDDISRFIYLPKGSKSKPWLMKVDLSTVQDVDDIEWLIDHDKYVNRPDSIAHKFYGNSKFWWVIAARNSITDPFHGFYKGRKLIIPSMAFLRQILGANYV